MSDTEYLNQLSEFITNAEAIILSQQKRVKRVRLSGGNINRAEMFLALFIETLEKLSATKSLCQEKRGFTPSHLTRL